MKRTILYIIVILFAVIAQGQTKPIEHKLSPEASKAIIKLEVQRKAITEEIDKNENYIFLGAGIPADSRQCSWDASQIVICVKPETAKASPEKK